MTNIDRIGSELDVKLKFESASSANEWQGAGKAPGLLKWRIENFKVAPCDPREIASFFSGDSYIVLSSYKNGRDTLGHNIHFWQGEGSSQDEKGVSAYKATELDNFLGGGPTQHREVQGNESRLFLSYFPELRIMEGGIDSGFSHVEKAESHAARLLHVKGTMKSVSIKQVACNASSVNSGDVFILDCGTKLIQFQGKESGGAERMKAGNFARNLCDHPSRGGKCQIVVFDESEAKYPQEWMDQIGKGPFKSAEEGGNDRAVTDIRTLFLVSDASGKLEFKKIAEGKDVKRTLVNSNDAFILYARDELYVWVGMKASDAEKKNAFLFAQQYITEQKLPQNIPIHSFVERGFTGENEAFEEAFF